MRKKIGVFSAQLIEILELNIPAGAPIYIADSNIEHMKTFHPDDFAQYGSELSNIIANPDYVKKNAKDDSIEFTKEYYINGEYVKVAVRISMNRSPSSRQLKKYKFFLPVEIYLLAVFMQLASKFHVFPLALKFQDSFASVYCCSNLYNLRSFLREYLYQ